MHDISVPMYSRRQLIQYGMVAGFSHGDSREKYNLTEPILLQVEHVAVEFVVEPDDPSL